MAHCSTENLQPVVLQFDVTFNTRRLAAHIYPPKWSQKPVRKVKKLHKKASTQIKSLPLVDISFFAVNIVRSWNILMLKSSENEIIWQLKKTLRIIFVNDIIFCFLCLCLVLACVTMKISADILGRYLRLKVKGQTVERWVDISCIVLTFKDTFGHPSVDILLDMFWSSGIYGFQNVKTNIYFIYGATKSKKYKF